MRLIDADVLIQYLGFENTEEERRDNVGDIITLEDIDNQPTAYSVDKVVTELNELDVKAIKRYKGGTFGDYKGTDYYIEKSKAIKIVKQGCVSDDVCEWELTDTRKVMPYKTSCGNEDLYDNSYKYCPYCGKKIRMVE